MRPSPQPLQRAQRRPTPALGERMHERLRAAYSHLRDLGAVLRNLLLRLHYFTTIFTSLAGTTTIFTTVLPSSLAFTFSSARAAAFTTSSSLPAATFATFTSLPFT